ncbi:MAG TPA: class I SAM-dependent methyltransferase [bacterium]|nr:class I SAM-dependent methyltransferase [bacterium]
MNDKLISFYNNLYSKKQTNAMRPFKEYQFFLNFLKPFGTDQKILDVACGTGFLLKAAVDDGLKTYGIDIANEAVKISQKNSPQSEIFLGLAEELPFANNFFDFIYCLGSIEHFSDINKGLLEMLRVGKENAKYLLVVPNKNYFAWWFTQKKGTHQRDIGEELKSLKEWVSLFESAGFRIIKIKQDKWPTRCLPWFYSFNPLKIFKRLFFKLIWMVLPLKYTYQFIIVAEKK